MGLAVRALGLVPVYAVYLLLAQPSPGSLVAFPLAIAVLVGAWQLEHRRDAGGWFQLGGLVFAMLVLLAGRGWIGAVPWQGLFVTTVTILIFVLFALGLNLEFGFAGLINFGHVAFMSIGAYAVALLAIRGGLWTTQPGVLLTLLLALVAAALAGLLLAVPAIRLRADYLAIVTIAAAEILRRVLLSERDWTRGAQGIAVPIVARPLHLEWLAQVPSVGTPIVGGLDALSRILGFRGTSYTFILLLFAIVGTVGFVLLFERLVNSPWGRVIRAIREDDDAARALGINPTIYKLQVFAIGSAAAAVAGALWAWQIAFVSPDQFMPTVTFWAWIMIVIGGVGNNKGAVAGAFIFWTINELTRNVAALREVGLDSEQVAAFSTLALGALLIGVMVFKPEGLFGDREEMELVE